LEGAVSKKGNVGGREKGGDRVKYNKRGGGEVEDRSPMENAKKGSEVIFESHERQKREGESGSREGGSHASWGCGAAPAGPNGRTWKGRSDSWRSVSKKASAKGQRKRFFLREP